MQIATTIAPRRGARTLCTLLLATAMSAAHAQPGPDAGATETTAEPEVGDEVELLEVTGKQRDAALAVDLEQYGNKVQIVDAAEIEAGGYTNIAEAVQGLVKGCLLYTSPSPRDRTRSRMPSSA